MKIAGIIILVLGCISTFGGVMAAAVGGRLNLSGLTFIVLGIFLISRAKKKKEEEEEKSKWEQGDQGNA